MSIEGYGICGVSMATSGDKERGRELTYYDFRSPIRHAMISYKLLVKATTLLVSILLFCASSIASAQTSCLQYLSNSTPPTGYGASWDVTSIEKELLVKSNCPTSGSDIQIIIGKGDTSQFIWSKTYVYNVAVTPPRWDMHTLTGTVDANGWVTSGAGTKSVTAPHTPTATNPLYIVGYVCTFHSSQWKCGCANAACTTKHWQLQGYTGNGGGTTGGSGTGGSSTGGTGGTTGGGGSCPQKNDIFLNPFNKDSAHHRPIGTGAVYADANHPATRTWNTRSGIGINVGMPFGTYAVKSNPTDPLQTIRGTGYGLPAQLRLPAGFNPGAVPGRDSVVSLLTLDNQEVHDLWRFEVRSDGFHASINRTYAGDELGHPSRLGERLGVSASGVGLLFGALRGTEINTPGRKIQHALQMVIPGTGSNSMLSKEIRLPAGSMDNFCRDNPTANCLGNIPYGGLLALPPESKGGPDLHALGLSEPGLRLAEAIRDYGVYAVDTGGAVAIRADQQVSPEVRRQLVSSDLPKIYRHMRLVLNSAWTPGQQAVGGGSPLAPNCAFDAP